MKLIEEGEHKYFQMSKKEFCTLSKEEKIEYFSRKHTYTGKHPECYEVVVDGFKHCRGFAKKIDDSVILIRHSVNRKKFLFNLDTCEKTQITQKEYEKIIGKVDELKKKREELLAELAKVEAQIKELEE